MDTPDFTTTAIFVCVFSILYYMISKPRNLPPAPRGWPLIGNLLDMGKQRGKIPEYSMKMSVVLGDIFRLQFGGIPVILVNGYNNIHNMLIKQSDVFSDRPEFLYFIQQVDSGVILSSGRKWKDLRRMSLHALRDFGMGKLRMEERIMEEVSHLVETMSEHGVKPFTPHTHLVLASANIICNIVFGSRYEFSDERFQKMLQLMNDVFKRPAFFQICNAFPILRYIPRFRKGTEENIRAFESFADFVGDIVKDHEQSYDDSDMRDFIDMFIKARQENNSQTSYSVRNFLRLIIDLFIAGTETTSTTLNWGLLYMIAHPDIQVTCQEEIDRVVGPGRRVRYSDKSDLPFVDATLYEVQRLGSIAPLSVPHATLHETTLGGYTIPKNSIVIPNLLSVHKDPNYWPEPEMFSPERFLKDGKVIRPDAFMPFSIGPRQCAGEALAKMELFLVFSNLLQSFTFRKPNGVSLNLEGFTGQTRSPPPFQLIAHRR